MLERDYTQEKTQRELKDELRDFDDTMKDQADRLHDMEVLRERLMKDIDRFHSDENKLNSQVGKLVAEEDNHNKLLRERLKKLEYIAEKFGLDLVTQTPGDASVMSISQSSVGDRSTTTMGTENSVITISDEDMNAFRHALKAKETQLKSELENQRSATRAEEDHLNRDLSALEAKRASIENDIAKVDKELQGAQSELQQIGSGLKHGRSMGRVTEADVKDAKERAKMAGTYSTLSLP
jgi:chromosome segregation ATPase